LKKSCPGPNQGIACNCEGGSRKRKYKNDAGKLAALMGK